jgi:hypothetical protein
MQNLSERQVCSSSRFDTRLVDQKFLPDADEVRFLENEQKETFVFLGTFQIPLDRACVPINLHYFYKFSRFY